MLLQATTRPISKNKLLVNTEKSSPEKLVCFIRNTNRWLFTRTNQLFGSSGSLHNHRISIHRSGSARLRCPDCPETFSLKQKLTNHVMTKHSNRKPFRCQVGSAPFRRKTSGRQNLVDRFGTSLPNDGIIPVMNKHCVGQMSVGQMSACQNVC